VDVDGELAERDHGAVEKQLAGVAHADGELCVGLRDGHCETRLPRTRTRLVVPTRPPRSLSFWRRLATCQGRRLRISGTGGSAKSGLHLRLRRRVLMLAFVAFERIAVADVARIPHDLETDNSST